MNNINTNKLTVTLLSLEQIYGDKRLKIFDKFGIKVRQLSMNREFINDYDSLADAQRATNIPYQSISAVCNGKYSQAGGYIWEYAS